MPEPEVDLASLFETVARTLKSNQTALNKADAYNHDHGDNMVKNFRVISRALKRRPGAPPSEQLSTASDALRKSSITGSARMYAQGLSSAANKLQDERAITAENAFTLVQAIMGGSGEPPAAAAHPASQKPDLLGSLVGSQMGGGTSPSPKPQADSQQPDLLSSLMGSLMETASENQGSHQQGGNENQPDLLSSLMGSLMGAAGESAPGQQGNAGGDQPDLLGSLMGSLMGGGESATSSPASPQAAGIQEGDGLDLGDIVSMGVAYFQAKQQGAETLDALVQAVMSGSQMNDTPHHSQSAQIVSSTLLETLATMLRQ